MQASATSFESGTTAAGCVGPPCVDAVSRRISGCWWAPGWGVGAVVLLLGLGTRGDLDGHEVLAAQTAREMYASGDWVTPRFAGEVRLQKPPLAYWATAISYRLTGRDDAWAARLPFALAMWAQVLLLGGIARRWFGPAVGGWSAVACATAAWAVMFGKTAQIDSALSLGATAAVALGSQDRLCARRVISLWGVLGLLVLAKGPVGVLLVAPPILLYRWVRSRRAAVDRWIVRPAGLVGLLLFAGLAFSWPTAMLANHPGAFELWYGQSVARFVEHYGPNTRPWYYYFYQLPLWLLPWTPFCGVALQRIWKDREKSGSLGGKDGPMLLLLLWGLWGLLFLSLSEGKREHYLLPCLPPWMVLAAIGVREWSRSSAARWRLCCGLAAASAVGYCAHDLYVRPVTAVHHAAHAMFERRRKELDEAPVVLQYGNNERWTIFALNRPIRWLRTPDEMQREIPGDSGRWVLAAKSRLEELRRQFDWKLIDQVGPERGWVERGAKHDLTLVWMRRR